MNKLLVNCILVYSDGSVEIGNQVLVAKLGGVKGESIEAEYESAIRIERRKITGDTEFLGESLEELVRAANAKMQGIEDDE